MSDAFDPCPVPWRVGPWGLHLTHADTDVTPECSVRFGAFLVDRESGYEDVSVEVEFDLAGFASAKPHRDDEELVTVTGYEIPVRTRAESPTGSDLDEKLWLETGLCPDPGFYFSTDSAWLQEKRDAWARRQRTDRGSTEAVHFLLDGRDGYVELIAAGFRWRVVGASAQQDGVVSGEWPER